MKNLKKLLIAVAVLALLVTGVVITAVASSNEDAEFNRAKLFYSYVESERGTRAKSEELKSLYEFVESSSLGNSVKGFAEFKASYQAASLKIGYSLYNEASKIDDALGRFNALYQVRVHFKSCPVDANTEGYSELMALITADMEQLVRDLYDEVINLDLSVEGADAKKRELLLSIFTQVASIELDTAKWDYYYFTSDYNTSSIESAMALAEIAAGMFAKAEAEAREQYKSDLIVAIAQMYGEQERELYLFELFSDANAKAQAAYDAKFSEEMAKDNAVEADAIAAATAAKKAAYDAAVTGLKNAANAAYDAAIADGKTAEEAKLAYDKVLYASVYKAYDDVYASNTENLEAEAEQAYKLAYDTKLNAIYNAAYNAKLDEIYNAVYAEKYAEVYAAETEAEGADLTAADATAKAAAEEAANAAKAAPEAISAAEEAANAAKAAPEAVSEATEAAEAAKAVRIEQIINSATEAAEAAFSSAKLAADNAALSRSDTKYVECLSEFRASLENAYNEAYAKVYAETLLKAEGAAKNAYTAAYTAAKEGGAAEADAVAAGFAAYWAKVEEEANLAYEPAYKANYENALAILLSGADKKYKEAYDAAIISSSDTAAAKAAGKKAYDGAVSEFKAKLKAAGNDATAYEKVINDALKAIADAAKGGIYEELLISVEYEFTLDARNAYNKEYQRVYEIKLQELNDATHKKEEVVMAAVAAAKAAAELAYNTAIEASVTAAFDSIAALLGNSVTDVKTAIAKLDDFYKAAANAMALERCEQIKAEILESAQRSAAASSADAYDDAIAKYMSPAEEAAKAAGDKAYDDLFNKIMSDFCRAYGVSSEDAQKAIDGKAKYEDPIKDESLKSQYSAAVKEFEDFYSKCDIEENLGSLIVAFEKLDTILKGVALTDTRFVFVECLDIPETPNVDHPYPLNERNSVISKVQSMITANGLDSSVAGFSEFYAQFLAEKAKYNQLLEKAKNEIDRLANLDEYSWTSDKGYYEYKEDFSGGAPLTGYNQEGDTKILIGNENGNFNTTLNWGETKKHLYVQPSFTGKYENGVVLNLDMKFSSDFHYLQFRVIGKNSSGVQCLVDILGMEIKNGALALCYNSLDNVKTYVEGILDTGAWNHFSFTYNHSTHTGSLYVNYEYIGDISYYDTANASEVDLQSLRINADTTYQAVSLDNLHFFAGNSYRDYYKLQGMSNGEVFKYCVDLFTDSSLNAANRNGAYVKAKGLYQDFVNDSAYNEYTKYFTDSKYADYYLDDIKNPAIKSNMEKIAQMFSQIPAVDSSNISSVRTAITNIDKFIANNADFLDRTSNEYIEQMAELGVIEAEILRAEYVRDFVESLRFFDRATTLASMTKHYEKAKHIYLIAGYAKSTELVINDPAVTKFTEDFGTDSFTYYLENAVEKMSARAAFENSRRIVDCLNFILDMKVEVYDENGNVVVKGYEATEEFWLANYEYINTYVTIIRSVVSSGLYDADYTEDGQPISYYIEKYEPINAYFYELLQKEHLEHLVSQFDAFSSADSYIQKVGICNYIKNYVEDNDIDVTRKEFADILNKVKVYEAELESQEKDYASILNQNTQYFITTVNKMCAYVDYEDIIVLFEEATEYYYLMNVHSDAVKAAIEIYDAYAEKLESIVEYSTLFISYAREIKLAVKYTGERREKALYAGLVNAMSCVDGIDLTYDGVAEAYEIYEQQLAAYNNEADSVNSAISEIADATCAVRTNVISKIVLAIVKTIFSN